MGTTSLLPLTRADGAKATIKLGKERAPLSWQITLMSKTATSYSKLTRLVLRERKRDLTKDLKRINLLMNHKKRQKRNKSNCQKRRRKSSRNKSPTRSPKRN